MGARPPIARLHVLAPLLAVAGCYAPLSTDGAARLDAWVQGETDRVDVLWVVDDSATMADKQAHLAEAAPVFTGGLAADGSDFHLAVTTTSLAGQAGGALAYTTADDYGWADAFAEQLLVGTTGADKEKGFESALTALASDALDPFATGDGFLRDSAQLLVVFVSDEEDCSDGGSLDGDPAAACYTDADRLIPVVDVVRDLRAFNSARQVAVGAIVGAESEACADVYRGERYLEAVAYTGGVAGDICADDWSDTLDALSFAASGMWTKFLLNRPAQPDTIEVTVDGDLVVQDPADGWTYESDTWFLVFHGAGVPGRGAEIRASYSVDPSRTVPAVGSVSADGSTG